MTTIHLHVRRIYQASPGNRADGLVNERPLSKAARRQTPKDREKTDAYLNAYETRLKTMRVRSPCATRWHEVDLTRILPAH